MKSDPVFCIVSNRSSISFLRRRKKRMRKFLERIEDILVTIQHAIVTTYFLPTPLKLIMIIIMIYFQYSEI